MGGGSPSNTTQTQQNKPPDYVLPYLQNAADTSQRMWQIGPPTYYEGNTVTPFSQETEQALSGITQRATNGSPVEKSAQGFLANTFGQPVTSQFGGGQNPHAKSVYNSANNPHLDATVNRGFDQIQNRIQSGFAGSGRNIDAARPLASQEFGDFAAKMYGGAYENDRNRQLQADMAAQGIGASGYENERNRMLQDISGQRAGQIGALGAVPQISGLDYSNLGQLASVGAQREDLVSRNIADAVSRHDYDQNRTGIALDQYIARLNNQPGGSSSVSTPYFRNRAAGGLGGAAMGYGLGNEFGYGGYGAAIGGLLGAFG